MHRPLLLGHRGVCGSASVKENTFAAFDLALSQGCDGFEFDVRLTADGVAVVCHGPRFKRRLIRNKTASQVAELPRLDRLLKKYADQAFLDIEIKEPGLGPVVLSALRAWPPGRGHVVSSFLPEVLAEIRALDSSVPLGFIFDRKRDLQRWRELSVEYLVPHHFLVSAQLVDEGHQAGKKLLVWTVNRQGGMRRLALWGIDGIISDRTELLVKTFDKSRELHASRGIQGGHEPLQ